MKHVHAVDKALSDIAKDAAFIHTKVTQKYNDYDETVEMMKELYDSVINKVVEQYVLTQLTKLRDLHDKYKEFNSQLRAIHNVENDCESFSVIEDEAHAYYEKKRIEFLRNVCEYIETVISVIDKNDFSWWATNGDITVFDQVLTNVVGTQGVGEWANPWTASLYTNYRRFTVSCILNLHICKAFLEDKQKAVKEIRAIYKAREMKNEMFDKMFPPKFTPELQIILSEIMVTCIQAGAASTTDERVKYAGEMRKLKDKFAELLE